MSIIWHGSTRMGLDVWRFRYINIQPPPHTHTHTHSHTLFAYCKVIAERPWRYYCCCWYTVTHKWYDYDYERDNNTFNKLKAAQLWEWEPYKRYTFQVQSGFFIYQQEHIRALFLIHTVLVSHEQVNNPLRLSDAIWQYRSGSTLAHVMVCCLMAPSHYLSQCWIIIEQFNKTFFEPSP